MSSLATMQRQVRAMRQILQVGVRHWHIALEAGYGIPDEIRDRIAPGDRVVIREYPYGLLDGEQHCSAWCEEDYKRR